MARRYDFGLYRATSALNRKRKLAINRTRSLMKVAVMLLVVLLVDLPGTVFFVV
jgi:hypothetical protein